MHYIYINVYIYIYIYAQKYTFLFFTGETLFNLVLKRAVVLYLPLPAYGDVSAVNTAI